MGALAALPVRCATLAAALLACTVLAGCGGGERPRVPAGYTEYRTGEYSFAYPSGWQRRDDKDEYGRPTLLFMGPRLPSGAVDGQIHVGRIADYRHDLDVQLGQFRALATMHRYRLTADRRIEIDGAKRAHRFEATYEMQDQSGASVPFTLLGLYALTDDGVLLEFMLRSPQNGAARSRLPVIFDSFRLDH
ncbi:hypothetical protein Acsp04_01800 [Actinomadura sp. NBRC 104425]|uniref:hypothetical protein n=1 Tax=Actinomadura sp. NBRC 104425 TaxID=3032204 RepID=UPI0024A28CBA|nr:hypothetical protein [Actinomadura sp. NBRC 104425]GLZ09945.1 hypothetical protein Acsp04_01800 [Actinomadura sp. NBRC 104425]